MRAYQATGTFLSYPSALRRRIANIAGMAVEKRGGVVQEVLSTPVIAAGCAIVGGALTERTYWKTRYKSAWQRHQPEPNEFPACRVVNQQPTPGQGVGDATVSMAVFMQESGLMFLESQSVDIERGLKSPKAGQQVPRRSNIVFSRKPPRRCGRS
uniref:Uncharacterized protein n=1 Tax=Coccidioides posadasii RMSCC 3488 TaxID=454284 RepID=A0A0J6FF16_COCPO|nr:hypothetical protein CPAG_04208 [Coccidioides posadasii RMSCC 3488]